MIGPTWLDWGKEMPEWRIESGLADYAGTLAAMEQRASDIRAGEAGELIWLVEHPPVYTAGTSADTAELLAPARFPVFATGRGGRYTYHGPGQRVGYLMLDLEQRGRDLRGFICSVERWLIAALADFGVSARAVPGRVGVWTDTPAGEAKIGAIGVRVRRWVSFHGFSLNVAPDLEHFSGIVPCGLAEYPVTSLAALGIPTSMADVDAALRRHCPFL